MGILFTAVGDVPHLLHLDDWARLALSTLGTMIALRNLLVSMYEASKSRDPRGEERRSPRDRILFTRMYVLTYPHR